VRMPPASHSATTASSTALIDLAPYWATNALCPLAVVDVRGLLRTGEQRIGRPALPEGGERDNVPLGFTESRTC